MTPSSIPTGDFELNSDFAILPAREKSTFPSDRTAQSDSQLPPTPPTNASDFSFNLQGSAAPTLRTFQMANPGSSQLPPADEVDSSTAESENGTVVPPGDRELAKYLEFLNPSGKAWSSNAGDAEEVKTTPLFTWPVKQPAATPAASHIPSLAHSPGTTSESSADGNSTAKTVACPAEVFKQYSVLGKELPSAHRPAKPDRQSAIFLNTDAPWSAFLCGSQGSGKSYTLSCILENCLMSSNRIGNTPKPLAGIVFAYDAHSAESVCEAAYLSNMIPVNVLVSPSNYNKMKQLYESKLGGTGQVRVHPLFLKQRHLNTQRMMRLMAVSSKEGPVPLYMEVIISILKDMAITATEGQGLDYQHFLQQVEQQGFDGGQKGPMKLRLNLLDSFMESGGMAKKILGPKKLLGTKHKREKPIDMFKADPGTLTIVDLTDPFVDSAGACVLFDICLSLFLEHPGQVGKVVALDEAHKFMGEGVGGGASENLTQNLLTVIREQRHKGARVVIATQEPTISPKLLDLCSVTFVHRFNSPEWLRALQGHLAGASEFTEEHLDDTRGARQRLFSEIVGLNVGESLLFSPSAMLDVVDGKARKLGAGHVKFKTRLRLTDDGGKSVMASDSKSG